MRRLIFVTSEYDPPMAGGAGSVVGELSRRLTSQGVSVSVIVVTTRPNGDFDGQGLDIRVVPPGTPDDEAPTQHLATSRSAAEAVAGLDPGPDDLIEFTDFWGLAHWSLTRRDLLGIDKTRIAVRFHGPMDLIYEVSGVDLAEEDVLQETDSYRLADFVFAPSAPMAKLIEDRYRVEPERIVIAEPPIPELAPVTYSPGASPHFICLGTPSEVKGSTDFLEAVIPLLIEHPNLEVSYLGGPGWSSVEQRPMRAVLGERIPMKVRPRVHFEPRRPRGELGEFLSTGWAVVLPSRFESFCLAAQEVRRLGLPVVLPALPAFEPYFSESTGAAVYDGTVEGLRTALTDLLRTPSRLTTLASASPPSVGNPLAPYRGSLPEPRHPRVQAGLATKSLVDLNRIFDERNKAHPLSTVGRSLLRVLPEPLARAAVGVLPKTMKDRFRRLASWPEEVERRERLNRLAAVEARIQAGDFPQLDDPTVSVVIPCFNQGRYLTDALVSVFEQTYGSVEIIVVDDGSTDPETLHIVDGLSYPRTRVIRQQNRGLPGARNAGMKAAKGRYLVPLDADDQLTPGFVEALLPALESNTSAAYAHCWAELFGNVSAVFATRPFNPYWITRLDSVIGCVLMRKDAWEDVGGYDETMVGEPEDWELWLRLMAEGWDQVLIPEPLFRYRKHGVTLGIEGEIKYEGGWQSLSSRHPELYGSGSQARLRRASYPLLTLVGTVNPAPEHAERVDSVDDLATSWGKYVVDIRQAEGLTPGVLLRMASALEDTPEASECQTTGSPPLTMLRRWKLHDADARPEGTIVIDDATPGLPAPEPGAIPRDGWSVTAYVGTGVQRQEPEEAWPIKEQH